MWPPNACTNIFWKHLQVCASEPICCLDRLRRWKYSSLLYTECRRIDGSTIIKEEIAEDLTPQVMDVIIRSICATDSPWSIVNLKTLRDMSFHAIECGSSLRGNKGMLVQDACKDDG